MAASMITLACLQQPRFHEQATAIRLSRQTVSEVALAYAKRGSAGQFVMEYILAAAARGEAEEMWPLLMMLVTMEQESERPVGRYMPGEKSLARWKRAANLIAWHGAGLCLEDGCEAEHYRTTIHGGPRDGWDGRIVPYCKDHFLGFENKRDARLIEDTFAVAARVIRWSFSLVGPGVE
jgi:hypothetical protein